MISKVTVIQASELAKVHVNTIYRHLYKGSLKGYKLGGKIDSNQPWYILEEDLKKWLRGEK
jgi:hypothetical protein